MDGEQEKKENLMKFQYEWVSERDGAKKSKASFSRTNVMNVYTHKVRACQMKWFMGLVALQPLTNRKGIYDEKFLFN